MNISPIASFKSKKGNEVILRYPTSDDFNDMYTYACDIGSEDTFIALDAPPTEEEERTFLTKMIEKVEKQEAIYLMAYVGDTFIGTGQVDRGKGRHKHTGHMGIALTRQYRDEGIGTEIMKSLIDEARKLGLRLLTLTCFETNAPALHVYEKLGFQKAGVIPNAIAYKGKYIGEVHYYLPLITD